MKPFAAFAALTLAASVSAHEGHVALPSRGAVVDAAKGTIVLTRESREALGVAAQEIAISAPPDFAQAHAVLSAPWRRHAFASSRLAGRIVKLHVAPGQSVGPGAALAEIESFELEALHQEIRQAEDDHRLAERLLATVRDSGGGVSGQELVDAEAAVEMARHRREIGGMKWRSFGLPESAREAYLSDAAKALKTVPVSAPLGGAIVHAEGRIGRVVEPGEHLFELVDTSTVWARLSVLESDLEKVAVGMELELALTARPGALLRGRIDAVGSALDPATKSGVAWATFGNPTGTPPTALPGMTGLARVLQPPPKQARVVPAAALIDDGLAQYVLVEEAAAEKQSEYRRKDVAVARRGATWAEVLSTELYPGDRVVTRGAHELSGFFVPGVLKPSAAAARTMGLRVAPVERRVVERTVELDGVVELLPAARAAASARLPGNISRVLAERGQRVRRGDVLAEVASNQVQDLLLEARREELSWDLAERRWQALRPLAGAVSERRLLEAEAAARSARLRRDAVVQRLRAAGFPEDRIARALSGSQPVADTIPVVAPIDGVVADFDKALGQAVRAEEPLFAVHDPAAPMVMAFAPEALASEMATGMATRIAFGNGEPLAGRLVNVGNVIAPEEQALPVWIAPERKDDPRLRHGRLTRVAVALPAAALASSLAVPLDAVVREGAAAFVFVRQADNTFVRRPVSLGRSNDLFVETLSGLAVGEPVAVRGAAGLRTAHASIR